MYVVLTDRCKECEEPVLYFQYIPTIDRYNASKDIAILSCDSQ